MAIERRDPLPIGRYSIILTKDDNTAWEAWLAKYKGAVKVVLTTPQKATRLFTGYYVTEMTSTYTIFDVITPVPWVGLGLPDIVPPGTLPQPEPDLAPDNPAANYLGEIFNQVKTLLFLGGAIYLGAALLRSRR